MAAECLLELRSESGGTRTVKMDRGFYTGYRRNILTPDEVLVSLSVPFTAEDEHFVAFKQAKRRDDDIAIVNSAFFFKLSGSGEIQVNAPLLLVPTPALNSLPDSTVEIRKLRLRLQFLPTIRFHSPNRTTLTSMMPGVVSLSLCTDEMTHS